jgi:hypothetical protein
MLDHFSYSAMSLFYRCGEAWRRRYVEGEKLPPGIAQLRGTGFHGGAKVADEYKIATREVMGQEHVRDATAAAFDSALMAGGVLLDSDEESRGKSVVVGEAKDSAIRLIDAWRDNIAPTYQPDLVEKRIEIRVPNIAPKLVGIVDLATEDGVIVDRKTASAAKGANDVKTSMQLTWYDVSYQALTGKRAKGVQLHEVVDTKTPQALIHESTRDDEDRRVLGKYIERAIEGIAAGRFLPATPGSWMCSQRWCGYYTTCSYVRKGQR